MKTYSFKAHGIGTEVWTDLNGFAQNDIVEEVQACFYVPDCEPDILYKLKSSPRKHFTYSGRVFLTKEAAEKSL